MTDHHPQPPPSRDTRGNVVGDITHPDGTAESVDALNAGADAFQTADTTQPLLPPTDPARRARHAAIRGEVAAEEAVGGHGEADSGPTGLARTSCPRCEGRGRVTIPCPHRPPQQPDSGREMLGPAPGEVSGLQRNGQHRGHSDQRGAASAVTQRRRR